MGSRTERRRAERARLTAKAHLRIGGAVVNRACELEVWIRAPHAGPTGHGRKVRAIVDTGCTASAINGDVARDLGLPVIGVKTIQTANSNTDCPEVAARLQLNDGRSSAGSPPIGLVVARMHDEMLFGMDLMKGGILTVDLISNTWEWKLTEVR